MEEDGETEGSTTCPWWPFLLKSDGTSWVEERRFAKLRHFAESLSFRRRGRRRGVRYPAVGYREENKGAVLHLPRGKEDKSRMNNKGSPRGSATLRRFTTRVHERTFIARPPFSLRFCPLQTRAREKLQESHGSHDVAKNHRLTPLAP